MKTTTKIALCVWAFLTLLALEPARAFYDPGTQRWLNRDPLGDPGHMLLTGFYKRAPRALVIPAEVKEGPNLFLFVRNAPHSKIDGDGRSLVTLLLRMLGRKAGTPQGALGGRIVCGPCIFLGMAAVEGSNPPMSVCMFRCDGPHYSDQHHGRDSSVVLTRIYGEGPCAPPTASDVGAPPGTLPPVVLPPDDRPNPYE